MPNGEIANIWTTKFANFTDTSYVVSSSQEVLFYYPPCWSCTAPMPTSKLRYIFPLQINGQWFSQKEGGDSIKVISQNSILIGKKNYDAYLLTKIRQPAQNYSTQDTLWFVPKIGMVKLVQREYNLGPIPGNGVWELINYSLK